MKNIGLFAITLVMVFACGKTEEKKNSLFSASSNLDINNFWINSVTLTKGITHSGLFASKIDTMVEYGIGIAAKINDLATVLPKKVTVHCWIYSNEPNLDGSLVCDPNINGQSLNWQSFNLTTAIPKAKEWTEFSTTFDLPKNLTPDTELKVFFWNPKKKIYFVDDFEITLE